MQTNDVPFTGGCQCGAIRFSCASLGRATICHCRMCQKAFGGYFGPFVTARGLRWTRGAPAHFRSSNRVRRGFCAACGTPLTFDVDASAPAPGGATPSEPTIEVAIGAFDRASEIAPVLQLSEDARLPSFDTLPSLRTVSDRERERFAAHYAAIVSYQHPDHDTHVWPAPSE